MTAMSRTVPVLIAMLAVCAASAGAQVPSKPNVVLIVTDDVGYGDIGSYGAPDVKTPNIDSLARDGVRMTDFYAAPQCTPTRAALISGRYQQRFRLDAAMGGPKSPSGQTGLPARGYSLPQLLKNNGYSTGLIGKWHLGYKPEFSPNAHGFEYFFGFKSGYIDYYQHTGGNGDSDLFENATPVQVDGYMTDLITERSVKFVQEHSGSAFFLEVTYNAAHWPFQTPDHPSVAADHGRFVQPDESSTATRQDYIAMLERADQGIGRILQELRRRGLERNTLVIYMQDNGGEWLSRNAPLFNRKGTVWEGGIRVPAIFKWPGHLPAGRVSNQVGIVQDVTASILAATKTSVPSDAKPDGINLMPILEGRTAALERTLFFRFTIGTTKQLAVRQGSWKLLVDGAKRYVFDLSSDIAERNDLARQRQDIAHRLRLLIDAWEADVDGEASANAARETTSR
ncbi:MAG TPA: sulfatase-like hydrolase/transferase [Blastocatellia bacterium]|nr:sulfatase-like hydrolase/transferase [Blastocatellia bacterium]